MVVLSGNGVTMRLLMVLPRMERQSMLMEEIMEKRSMTAISVWMDWYIRTELYTQDCWNTRMYTARQGLFPMIKKVESWCFTTIWILMT